MNRLIICLIIIIALSIPIFSQSEWVQIIPNSYADVYFDSPSLGWAAGDGVIRKTTDGGNTWKTVLSDHNANITRIEFGEGGGTGYGISSHQFGWQNDNYGDGSLYYATQGGSKWEKITLDENYNFSDVSIDYDSQEGYQIWLASRETVHYSKGFTNNFIERRNGINKNHSPLIIKFIDHDIGWVMTSGYDTVSLLEKNYLYHTTDGGLNWNKQFEFDYIVTTMRFSIGGAGIVSGINRITGAAREQLKYIFKTNDFGNTWDELNLSGVTIGKIKDVIKEDGSNRIWVAGEFVKGNLATSLLFNDSPFFDDWQPDSTFSVSLNALYQYKELNRITIPNPSDGRNMFIVGNDIYYSQTSNYERDWKSAQFTVKNFSLNDIHFFNSSTGFAVGPHKAILKTTDSGDNWIPINYDESSNSSLFKIFFLDDSTGWACGSNGIVFLTSDAGETWIEKTSGAHTELHDIYFVSETRGIAVGGSWADIGFGNHFYQSLLTTDDGGNNWNVSEQQEFYDILFDDLLRAIFFINETEGWIAGGNTVMHTTDAGNTWEETYCVPPNTEGCYNIKAVYFSDSNNGLAAGGGGPDQVWRTTDAGKTWLDVTWDNQWSHGGYGIDDIDFASGRYWAISSTNSYISNYYGSSWEVDRHGYIGAPSTIQMFDQNTGFLSGGKSFVRRQSPILTSIDEQLEDISILPNGYSLSQNYPNPFNPTTKIRFTLPIAQIVILKVYDVLGKEVKELVNDYKNSGVYEISFDASELSSGVYFYRLSVNGFSEAKKMLIIK